MKRIYKYDIEVNDQVNDVKMPHGAEIVHVDVQVPQDPSRVQIWALIDTDNPMSELRRFIVYGTGHNIMDVPMEHIGTAICYGGQLVWHVFELQS